MPDTLDLERIGRLAGTVEGTATGSGPEPFIGQVPEPPPPPLPPPPVNLDAIGRSANFDDAVAEDQRRLELWQRENLAEIEKRRWRFDPVGVFFRGLHGAGNLLAGGAEDIGLGAAYPLTGQPPNLENVRSALTTFEPTPLERDLQQVPGVSAALTHGGISAIKTAPTLAAGAAITAVTKLPPGVVYPGLFGAEAYERTGSAYETLKAATIGALYPLVGTWVKPTAALLINKLGASGSPVAQKAIETVVDQALMQAATQVISLPEYEEMVRQGHSDQIASAIAENVGNILLFAVPRVIGYARGQPAEYEHDIMVETARLKRELAKVDFRNLRETLQTTDVPEERTAAEIRAGLIRPGQPIAPEPGREVLESDFRRALRRDILPPEIPAATAEIQPEARERSKAREAAARFAASQGNVPFVARVAQAERSGRILSFWSAITGTRPGIFVRVGNGYLPFYRSSQGTGGGKIAGEWQPFFGFGRDQDWLIKGDNDQIRNKYYSPEIAAVTAWLNRTFNWPHELDLDLVYNSERTPLNALGKPRPADETLREVVYQSEFNIIHSDSAKVQAHINGILDRLGVQRGQKAATTTEVPSAVHETPKGTVRTVQQPGGTTEGEGQVPTNVSGAQAGARGGGVAGTSAGEEVKAPTKVILTIPEPKEGDIVELHGYIGQYRKDEAGRPVIKLSDGRLVEVNEPVKLRLTVTQDGKIVWNGVLYEPAVGGGKPWRNAYEHATGRLKLRRVDGTGGVLYLVGPSSDYVALRLNAMYPLKPQTKPSKVKGITEEETSTGMLPGEHEEIVDTPVDEFILNAGLARELAENKAARMEVKNNISVDLPEFTLERMRRHPAPQPHSGDIKPARMLYSPSGPHAGYLTFLRGPHYSYRIPLAELPAGSWGKLPGGAWFDKRAILAFLSNNQRRFANRNASGENEYFTPQDIDAIRGVTGKPGRPRTTVVGDVSLDQPAGEEGQSLGGAITAEPRYISRMTGIIKRTFDNLLKDHPDLFNDLLDKPVEQLDEAFWGRVREAIAAQDEFKAIPTPEKQAQAIDLMLNNLRMRKETPGGFGEQGIIQGRGLDLSNPEHWSIDYNPRQYPKTPWTILLHDVVDPTHFHVWYKFKTLAEAKDYVEKQQKEYDRYSAARDAAAAEVNPHNFSVRFEPGYDDKYPWQIWDGSAGDFLAGFKTKKQAEDWLEKELKDYDRGQQGGLRTRPGEAFHYMRDPQEVATLQEIRTILDRPDNGLPEESKAVLRAMLESPVMQYFTARPIRFRLVDYLRNLDARYDPARQLIEMTRTGDPLSGAHEFFHPLWDMLKKEDLDNLKRWRDEAIASEMKTATGKDLEDLKKLAASEYSVRQFIDAGINRELYRYSSVEEYFAHMLTERWNQERIGVWGQAKNAIAAQDGFVAKVKELIRVIIEAIKRSVPGLRTQADALQRQILSGKYDVLPPSENIPGKRLVTSNAVVTAPGVKPLAAITAHHGTPHDVDRFSTERIGTGEGAQVYGWGLYYSQIPDVAREYANRLQGIGLFDGKNFDAYDPRHQAAILLEQRAGDRAKAIEDAQRLQSEWGASPHRETFVETRKVLERNEEASVSHGGNEYTVRLDVNPEDLLDWDKPLSQQSPKVQQALAPLIQTEIEIQKRIAAGQKFGTTPSDFFQNETGRDIYRLAEAVQHGAGPEGASEYLRELGIPGIKYLDQGSRAGKFMGLKLDRAVTPEQMRQIEEVARRESWDADHPFTEDDLAKVLWNPGVGPGQEAVARFARELIPEIRAEEVRSTEGGTYNFVIFDDKLIHITHRNGQEIPLQEAMGKPREAQGMLESPEKISKYVEPLEETRTPEKFRAMASVLNKELINPAAAARFAALPEGVREELGDLYGGRIATHQEEPGPSFREVMSDQNRTPEERSDYSRYALMEWQGYKADEAKILNRLAIANRKLDELTRKAIEAIPETNEAEVRATNSLGQVLDRIKEERERTAEGAQINERIREGIDHLDALNDLMRSPVGMAHALRDISELVGRTALTEERPGEEVLQLISERSGFEGLSGEELTPAGWVRALARHLDRMRDADGNNVIAAGEDVIEATLWMLRQRGDWKQELLEARMADDGTLRRFNAEYLNDLRARVPRGFNAILRNYATAQVEADALRSAANLLNRRIITLEERRNNLQQGVEFINQHATDPTLKDFEKAMQETTGAISGMERTDNGWIVTLTHPLTGNKVKLDLGFEKGESQETLRIAAQLAEAGLEYGTRPDANPVKAAWWRHFEENLYHPLMRTNPNFDVLKDPRFDFFVKELTGLKYLLLVESNLAKIPGILPAQLTRSVGALSSAVKTEYEIARVFRNRMLNDNLIALRSHTNGLKDNVHTLRQWRDEVAGPIIDSMQHFGQIVYRAGDMIAGWGHVITAEDIKAVKGQYGYDQRLIKLTGGSEKIPAVREFQTMIKEPAVKGRKERSIDVLRRPLSQGPGTTTRYLPDESRALPARWNLAVERNGVDAFLSRNDNFTKLVLGHVLEDERPYVMLGKGRFAGDYKRIRQDEQELNRSGRMPTNLQDLSQFIADLHNMHLGEDEMPATAGDVRRALIEEVTGYMRKLQEDTDKKETSARVGIVSYENEYTQARGGKVAPGTLYRYGITDTIDVIRKGNNALEPYVVRVRDYLKLVENALLEEKRKLLGTLNEVYKSETMGTRVKAAKIITEGIGPEGPSLLQRHQMTLEELNNNIDKVGKLLGNFNDIIRRREEFYGDDLVSQIAKPMFDASVSTVLLSPTTWIVNRASGEVTWAMKLAEVQRGGWLTAGPRLIKAHVKSFMRAVQRQLVPKNDRERIMKSLMADVMDPAAEQFTGLLADIQDWEQMRRSGVIDAYDYKDALGWDRERPLLQNARGVVDALRDIHAEPKLSFRSEFFGRLGMLPRGWATLWRKVGMRQVDNSINVQAIAISNAIAEMLRKRAIRSYDARLESDPKFRQLYEQYGNNFKQFALRLLGEHHRGILLTPAELTGRYNPLNMRKAAVTIRRMFERNNDPVDLVMLKYWWNQRHAHGDRNAAFMTPGQRWALQFTLAEDANMATPNTRPSFFMGSRERQMMGVLSQWWLWNTDRMRDLYSKVRGQNTYAVRYLPAVFGFLMATAVASLFGVTAGQKVNQMLYNTLANQPGFWDAETDEERLKILTSISANYWGMIGSAIKMATDTPGKLGYRNPFFLYNLATDLAAAATKIYQSGDWSGPTMDFFARYNPVLRAAFNRLPSREGLVDLRNASNALRAATPGSMEARTRQPASGSDIRVTPMTPLYNAILNAALVGDWATADEVFQRAVDQATTLGIPNPEQAIVSAIRTRAPESAVFSRRLTDEERDLVYSRLTPAGREAVDKANAAFEELASRYGGGAGGGGGGAGWGARASISGGVGLTAGLSRETSLGGFGGLGGGRGLSLAPRAVRSGFRSRSLARGRRTRSLLRPVLARPRIGRGLRRLAL